VVVAEHSHVDAQRVERRQRVGRGLEQPPLRRVRLVFRKIADDRLQVDHRGVGEGERLGEVGHDRARGRAAVADHHQRLAFFRVLVPTAHHHVAAEVQHAPRAAAVGQHAHRDAAGIRPEHDRDLDHAGGVDHGDGRVVEPGHGDPPVLVGGARAAVDHHGRADDGRPRFVDDAHVR
jgi:hypothetical protein